MSVSVPSRPFSAHGRLRMRRSYPAMAEINVTNLVDVIMVLLIIFMISAPLLQSGIDVALPQSAATTIDPKEDGVIVTIDKKGGVYIDDVWSKTADLEKRVRARVARSADKSVYLRADSTVPYGKVITVISRLRHAGITDVGLITNPQAEKNRK